MASSPSALASARARHGARAMGNKAGKPTRDDTGRASTSASDLAAKDANAAGAADAAAAASSSEPPTHEPVPGLRVVHDVLSEAQHDRVVAWLLDTLERGRAGALRGDTYAPIPDKWQKRNQSREMLQFGTYTHSNRVESFRDVEAMPEALSAVVECLRTAGVYGKQTVDDGVTNDETCETHALPTSCTVNFYEKGQWIPPHIDNPAFDRPVVAGFAALDAAHDARARHRTRLRTRTRGRVLSFWDGRFPGTTTRSSSGTRHERKTNSSPSRYRDAAPSSARRRRRRVRARDSPGFVAAHLSHVPHTRRPERGGDEGANRARGRAPGALPSRRARERRRTPRGGATARWARRARSGASGLCPRTSRRRRRDAARAKTPSPPNAKRSTV